MSSGLFDKVVKTSPFEFFTNYYWVHWNGIYYLVNVRENIMGFRKEHPDDDLPINEEGHQDFDLLTYGIYGD